MQTTIEKRDERLHMVVTPEDIKLLEQLCQKEGMNRSEFVRHLIRSYLDFIEMKVLLVQSQKRNNELVDKVIKLTRSGEIQDRLLNILAGMIPGDRKLENIDEIKTALRELVSLDKEGEAKRQL